MAMDEALVPPRRRARKEDQVDAPTQIKKMQAVDAKIQTPAPDDRLPIIFGRLQGRSVVSQVSCAATCLAL
jgi:hypothetical protein